MTPTTARHNIQTNGSSCSVTSIAKFHADLLDRLAKTLANLGRARCLLRSAIEAGDATQYELAYFEVEKLRADCSEIRLELTWRHAQQELAEQF